MMRGTDIADGRGGDDDDDDDDDDDKKWLAMSDV